jgi:Domain of unknown function (DUF4956)
MSNTATTSFQDLFKKSFIAMAGSAEQLSALDIVVSILITFAIGMFIYTIYKKSFQGVVYQKSFNISLVISGIVTSLIIMTISGNLVLSLGMVGALSIIRFRTPIKDSIDLVFLFWSITVGIANGVGYYMISIVGSIMLGLIILFLTRRDEPNNAYLLVLQLPANTDGQALIASTLPKGVKQKLKSKALNPQYTELTYEVRLKDENTDFLQAMKAQQPEARITLLSFRDELTSV